MPIPRLTPEQIRPDVFEQLRPRFERLGYVGEFFRCAGHQPDALKPFMEFTEALKKALGDRVAEIVALTVSVKLANDYERHQHERLCVKLGFGEQWLREVERMDPDAPGVLSNADRAVQRLVLALLERNGHNTSNELEGVVQAIGPEGAVGVLLQTGRYVTHALFVNSLVLEPPVPSPLS